MSSKPEDQDPKLQAAQYVLKEFLNCLEPVKTVGFPTPLTATIQTESGKIFQVNGKLATYISGGEE